MSRQRIVVGMSGGVDSSVTALLLNRQGFEVIGLFMKNWEDDDGEEYCSSRQDLLDAVSVADKIGIEIESVNFSAEYKERVFSEFLREYRAGRTAQSFFPYRLNQAQLSKTLFPLGTLYKREVREIARKHGLPNHDKKDSTGICFIGERPFREFLNRYLPSDPGDIYALDGRLVGKHMGLMFYTIGQRQGLGIGGQRDGDHDAWYVAAKDPHNNRLLGGEGHHPDAP